MRYFICYLLFLPLLLCAYQVEFKGLSDQNALKSIKSVSQLVSLKKRPPASLNALRYRAESDIPDILKVLRAYGYYEASIDIRIQEDGEEPCVLVQIHPGPVYTIEEYVIRLSADCPLITLEAIDIELGKPALAQNILASELKLMQILAECGYPLAQIEERKIIVDGETKGMRILLIIDTGPLCHFGKVKLEGFKDVKPRFIYPKVAWSERALYDARLIEQTQNNLMDSGLFSSIYIAHAEALDEQGVLPITIEVTENKHKSVSLGASYQTEFGPGVTFGWENRNWGGMGRKLSLQGDINKIGHAGTATLLIPNCYRVNQDFITQAVALRESITAYVEKSYSLTSRIERKFSDKVRASWGARAERLLVGDSVHNGVFTLFAVPLYFRWSSANDLLNPTRGSTFQYLAAPSVNVAEVSNCYLFQKLVYSNYYLLSKDDFCTFAQSFTFGSILSNHLGDIPVPGRFLGGTEDDLRGYRYKTVSPLIHDKPEGGRSALYYTAEMRFRLSESIGLVPFFDLGNVYLDVLPQIKGKWFKSVGIGLRYFSFMGPLRFDVAFPLDRPKNLDPVYRIFVSIGQTF